MILLLFLITYDSLPPLPDLSQIIFPEPPLWIEPAQNSLLVSGYTGDFYGGNAEFSMNRLYGAGFFERMQDWDTLVRATAEVFYSIPLSHFWVRPKLYGFLLERDERYVVLSPQLDFSSTPSWAVLFGNIETDLWNIDNTYFSEEKMNLEIVFDHMRYLPHFILSGIYTGDQLKPMFSGKLHLRNFHLEIGSPIFYSFPSPHFSLQYLDPKIKIKTAVKCGTIYSTLKDYFNSELPLKYRVPVSEESLKVALSLGITVDLFNHYFGLRGSYKNWNARSMPYEDFVITTAEDIQEMNIDLLLKNRVTDDKFLNIKHCLHLHYNWADTTITFLSRYDLVDTLDIHLNPAQISIDTRYLSQREGLYTELAPVVLISPTIGLKYKYWKIFLRIFNIADEKKEIFDNNFMRGRQYAGGLAFSAQF